MSRIQVLPSSFRQSSRAAARQLAQMLGDAVHNECSVAFDVGKRDAAQAVAMRMMKARESEKSILEMTGLSSSDLNKLREDSTTEAGRGIEKTLIQPVLEQTALKYKADEGEENLESFRGKVGANSRSSFLPATEPVHGSEAGQNLKGSVLNNLQAGRDFLTTESSTSINEMSGDPGGIGKSRSKEQHKNEAEEIYGPRENLTFSKRDSLKLGISRHVEGVWSDRTNREDPAASEKSNLNNTGDGIGSLAQSSALAVQGLRRSDSAPKMPQLSSLSLEKDPKCQHVISKQPRNAQDSREIRFGGNPDRASIKDKIEGSCSKCGLNEQFSPLDASTEPSVPLLGENEELPIAVGVEVKEKEDSLPQENNQKWLDAVESHLHRCKE